jgi:hypothetical protein
MSGDELDKFIGDILEAKQLSGLDNEVKAELIADLKQQMLDQINRAIISALPEEKLDEFNVLLEDPNTSEEAIQAYIMNSGVNINRVTTTTMLQFRELYLQSAEDRA